MAQAVSHRTLKAEDWIRFENILFRICGGTISEIEYIFPVLPFYTGTAVAQWLKYCATNRKVAGLIPDGVIGFFSSDRATALGSIQPLKEISTSNISRG
jgi:hypothetical protein